LIANTKLLFKVYKDSKGIGAYEVTNEDDTAIMFNPESGEDAHPGALKESVPETIEILKKKKEMKPIIENKQYVTGNFRGALQEYLVKMHPRVTLEFETEMLQPSSQSLVYVAKCKAVANQNESFSKLVGTGYAAVKKSAIHFSALDFMLKMKLLTEAQHFQIHQQWSRY